MTHKKTVQIIYLNGPSSSGKTTFAKALQEALETPFLHIGIDKIIGWMPEKINDWTGGKAPLGYSWNKKSDEAGHVIQELLVGPYAKKIARTFQEIVVLLAKEGYSLIIDDVSFGKDEVDVWKEALKNFSVLWVGIAAPLSVLEKREKERSNRIVGSARGQFYTVHADVTYDLIINTHNASLCTNLEKILLWIQNPKAVPTILIRTLKKDDIPKIIRRYSFSWSTIEKTEALWDQYNQEQESGKRTVGIVEKDGEILGYGSLLRQSAYPLFISRNIPEISALWIDENHRNKGLGRALIQWLENLATQEGYSKIGIGVGLYRDYGPAQKLYIQLGYAPDGNGITYKGQSTIPGQTYPLDDDLIIWLTKSLR